MRIWMQKNKEQWKQPHKKHEIYMVHSHFGYFAMQKNMSCASRVAPTQQFIARVTSLNICSCIHDLVAKWTVSISLWGSTLLKTVAMYTARNLWHTHREIQDSNLRGVLTPIIWGCQLSSPTNLQPPQLLLGQGFSETYNSKKAFRKSVLVTHTNIWEV